MCYYVHRPIYEPRKKYDSILFFTSFCVKGIMYEICKLSIRNNPPTTSMVVYYRQQSRFATNGTMNGCRGFCGRQVQTSSAKGHSDVKDVSIPFFTFYNQNPVCLVVLFPTQRLP